jgi:hypothetical protein
MGKPHDCETFDFPLQSAAFSYTITVKIAKGLGGTWEMAVQEAIDKARSQANDAGEAAMKGETCADDCECIVFVDVSIRNITPFKDSGAKKVAITVTGTWEAGILCIKRPKKSEDKQGGKSDGKPEGISDKKPDKKPKKKSGRKSKGKSKGKAGSDEIEANG